MYIMYRSFSSPTIVEKTNTSERAIVQIVTKYTNSSFILKVLRLHLRPIIFASKRPIMIGKAARVKSEEYKIPPARMIVLNNTNG